MLGWLAWLGHRRSIEREVRYSRELEDEVRRRTLELEQVELYRCADRPRQPARTDGAMPQVLEQAQANRWR